MAKQPRLINPNAHRPVNWNEKAVRQALDEDGGLIVQVKEDGIRFHAFILQGAVRIVTREGIEIRSLSAAKDALHGLLTALPPDFVVDGEVVVQGVTFEAGSGLLRAYAPIEHVVKFYVFDAFPMEALLATSGSAVETQAYGMRFGQLMRAGRQVPEVPNVIPIRGAFVDTMEQIEEFFEIARENSKEGCVVKRHTLGVRNGKVTGQWKLKPSDTCDGIIRGVLWGTPGLGNAGKIIGFSVELESGVLCDVTGITQTQMLEFTGQVQAYHAGTAGDHHPYIGRYIEVAYMELTASGSLRHPSFVKFRDLDYAPGVKS